MNRTPPDIIASACKVFGVTFEEFISVWRAAPIVGARRAAVVAMRRSTHLSYPEIAKAMRRPNHSSVITMHNAALEHMRHDPEFRDRVLAVCGDDHEIDRERFLAGLEPAGAAARSDWGALTNDEAFRLDPSRFRAEVAREDPAFERI